MLNLAEASNDSIAKLARAVAASLPTTRLAFTRPRRRRRVSRPGRPQPWCAGNSRRSPTAGICRQDRATFSGRTATPLRVGDCSWLHPKISWMRGL